MTHLSPLRYPGGKGSLTEILKSIIYSNNLQGCTYVEPFAGGAGAGLNLLREGHVDRVIINDFDRAIFCFWNSVMRRTDQLIERIHSVPLTIQEWQRQREIYNFPGRRSHLDIGFAAFYLNRCNRSGIIKKAGPIGGMAQSGKWKIGVRFNREELADRIKKLSEYGDRIIVLREDAATLIRDLNKHSEGEPCFVYADPPYYVKGQELYFSHFRDEDHSALASLIQQQDQLAWVMTYDDVPRIRELYKKMNVRGFKLRYSAHASSEEGGEVLISPKHVNIPPAIATMLAGKARNASKQIPSLEGITA